MTHARPILHNFFLHTFSPTVSIVVAANFGDHRCRTVASTTASPIVAPLLLALLPLWRCYHHHATTVLVHHRCAITIYLGHHCTSIFVSLWYNDIYLIFLFLTITNCHLTHTPIFFLIWINLTPFQSLCYVELWSYSVKKKVGKNAVIFS